MKELARLFQGWPQWQRVTGRSLKAYFYAAAFFTFVANFLLLVPPLHMLQVYDRVLISGSNETLLLISGLAVFLLVVFGFAEAGRRRALALSAEDIRTGLSGYFLKQALAGDRPEQQASAGQGNLKTLTAFLTSGQALAIYDAPFVPLFLAVAFMIHPLIGYIGLASAACLILLAILSEQGARDSVAESETSDHASRIFASSAARQHDTVNGLGMVAAVETVFSTQIRNSSRVTLQSLGASGNFSASAKSIRQIIQILALSAGAYLVLRQQASPGAIVAGSIIIGRALAPIDQCIGGWRQLIRVRNALAELERDLSNPVLSQNEATPLPRPTPVLEALSVRIAKPGSAEPLLPKFNLQLEGGSVLALVGASGVGKTAILRSLAGTIALHSGKVSLGGRDIHAWSSDDRGRFMGYLSQHADLLPTSILANITRLREEPLERVYELTQGLALHKRILSFADGYDTFVGPNGAVLSAGEKQGVCLARAFFGEPVLIMLDEPAANLDTIQVHALKQQIAAARKRGAIILLATHDVRMVEQATHIMALSPHKIEFFSQADYFAKIQAGRTVATAKSAITS